MEKIFTLILPALLMQGSLIAQGGTPVPLQSEVNQGLDPDGQISAETLLILRELEQRDRGADFDAAMKINDEVEARRLVDAILAEANVRSEVVESTDRVRQRLVEAGRTEEARRESIAYLRSRLSGEVAVTEAPESFRSRQIVEDPTTGAPVVRQAQPHFYNDNSRIVTYRNISEVPPVLIAYSKLSRVQVQQLGDTVDAATLVPVERRPAEYVSADAFSVSYAVDPNSVVTRDDILFVQGSTAFQDAYSYDLVQDIALAISDPSLADESFVIEGHASAEGDFADNLTLSQARAERIVREMVGYGISSSRLIPVGFGDNDAAYPADSADQLRALDRRVAVYRLLRSPVAP